MFNGYCRGVGEQPPIRGTWASDVDSCYAECKAEILHRCVAFSYEPDTAEAPCILNHGGPYTYGSGCTYGCSGFPRTCYTMPSTGIHVTSTNIELLIY